MTHDPNTTASTPAHASSMASPHSHGRPISWILVGVMIVGFILGGIGLIFGPNWVLFWVAVGVIVVAGISALASGIMDDYTT